MRSFDELSEMLDDKTQKMLGDSFIYTAEDGQPVAMKGFVDMGDGETSAGFTSATVGERIVQIRIATVPVKPTTKAVIHLPLDGRDYNPKKVDRDKSGRWWICPLKKVPQ